MPPFIMGVQSNMLGKTWWQQYEVVEHRKQGEGLGGRKGGRRKREGREGESEGERERLILMPINPGPHSTEWYCPVFPPL